MENEQFSSCNDAKIKLGAMISKCRGKRSLRSFATAIGLPASNVTYIEKGVNAPSPKIYVKIVKELCPDANDRKMMDDLYILIRQTPPPQVCDIILNNEGLCDTIKELEGKQLTKENIKSIQKLFSTF